jgi:hypothetical protein
MQSIDLSDLLYTKIYLALPILMEIEAAHSSYKTALFYADNACKLMNHHNMSGSLRRELPKILKETAEEMSSVANKDYFYTASVRKWYNILFYEKVKSNTGESLYNLAADTLDKAYKMRDLFERNFSAGNFDSELEVPPRDVALLFKFKASQREFANAVLNYESRIPILK